MSSISAILSSAASALAANQAALGTTSTNIANVNNPDYVRRQVQFQALNINGEAVGVQVGQIQRVVADFLQSQLTSSRSSAGTVDAMSDIHSRIQSMLGRPDDPNSMPSLVNQALAYPSELTLDPVSTARRMGYLQQLQTALSSISQTSAQALDIRATTDQTIAQDVASANSLIGTIFNLNQQIVKATAVGSDSGALQDQRDAALRNLSDLISIKTYSQPNGALTVTTDDGSELIGDNKVQLSYNAAGQSGTDVVYGQISAQLLDSRNGAPLGQPIAFDSHFSQGALRGLLTMRDNDLPNLLEQLGNLGASISDQINAVHNDSVAFPPANVLTGRQTGLVGGDAANFTGQTTLAVVDTSGKLVHSLTLDFTAGTYTVDNSGSPQAIPNGAGATIDDIVSAINSGLAGSASASFNNGVLSISATDPATGVGFSQPSTSGSSRGGRSFSQFFGLNDLVQAMRPSTFATGFTSSDLAAPNSAGYTAGQQFTLSVSDPTGKLLKQFTYTATGTETLQNIVDAINDPTNGLGQFMTFSLDSNGQLSGTPTAASPDAVLDVNGDNTDRGGTGVSFTAMFGIGRRYQMEQATDLSVDPQILAQPSGLALGQLSFDSTTQPGDIVAAVADSTGAQGLVNLATNIVGFPASGDLRKTASSLGDYAALVVGNTSNNAATVTQMQQAADSVKAEVESRRTSVEGVNLDEELSNMIIYQQAYNAAARLVTVAKDVYDTLLATVPQ